MSIPEKVLKLMKCCCSSNESFDHIVQEAILLNCGGNACRKCIDDLKKKEIKCKYCNRMHKREELQSMPSNPNVAVLIDTFSNDLIDLLKSEFYESIKSIEEFSNQDRLEDQIDFMEAEIDIRIESIRQKLNYLSEEFKRDLNKIRQSWKTLIPNEEINSAKESMKTLCTFKEIQQKCIEMKELATECFNKLNDIQFHTSDLEPTRALIGELQYPIYFDFRKIKQTKCLMLESKNLERCCILNDKIFITDLMDRKIRVISSDGDSLGSYNPKSILAWPLAICSSNEIKKKLFVGDCERHEIMVFDDELNLLKRFGRNLIKYPNSLTVDDDTHLVYVTDYSGNSLDVFNYETGSLISQITIDSPSHLKLFNDKLYVISGIEVELFKGERRLSKVTKGSNCVFEVEKKTLKIQSTIKSDKWLSPMGIHLEERNKYLFTAAYYLSTSNQISDYFYLFIINSTNGQFLHSLELDGIQTIRDFVYTDNKLIICRENEVKFIEFE